MAVPPDVVEVLRYAGAMFGLGGSGVGGYVLARFKKVEENGNKAIDTATNAIEIATSLRRQWRDWRTLHGSGTRDADDDRDSQAELTVQSLIARLTILEARAGQLESDLRSERGQRHALEKEIREYMTREAAKWTTIIEQVAEMRGSLRESREQWNRRRT